VYDLNAVPCAALLVSLGDADSIRAILMNNGNLEVKPGELDNLYKGILIGFFENLT